MQYVQNGKVKALAVGSPQRVTLLPGVPTVAENDVPGFDVSVWFGIAALAKAPPAAIAHVSREIAAIDRMADIRTKMAPLGYELTYLDSTSFAKKIATDHARYGKVIRDAGITGLGCAGFRSEWPAPSPSASSCRAPAHTSTPENRTGKTLSGGNR